MSRQEEQVPPLADFETSLGYGFQNRGLLELALQHSSYSHEAEGRSSNERLEFLGDSVLGLAVAHLVYEAHPDWPEGLLSRSFHNLVSRTALSRLARELGVGAHLRLGATELQSQGREKDSILEDSMEAVIGAIYMDGGLEPVFAFIRRVYAAHLAADAGPVERDPKSRLNEWAVAEFGVFPTYPCVEDSGVDGDDLRFTVDVMVAGERWGQGIGRSKRRAELLAAEQAMVRVDRGDSANDAGGEP